LRVHSFLLMKSVASVSFGYVHVANSGGRGGSGFVLCRGLVTNILRDGDEKSCPLEGSSTRLCSLEL
jgi:hypothetical protein